MTQLSRLATFGIAKESTPGTYVVPTVALPINKADWEDKYTELKDNSIRGNDSMLQGMYQGPVVTDWSLDMFAYPVETGHFLRGIIGPDTVTAGVSTTLSAATTAGATSITTAASIAAQSVIQIDTGTNLEYAKVTAVSGAGPYTLTVTGAGAAGGLLFAHASAVAVVSQTTHTFKQSATLAKATYSITTYDTTQTLGYAGAVFSDVSIKIDPKAAVTLAAKLKTFPTVVQSSFVPAYTSSDPVLGWEWNMTNAGGASTRGLTFDLNLKRAVDDIHSSDGVQAPREIFQGALDADGTYKAIFENQTDMNSFVNYTQTPVTATLTQPLAKGAATMTLTASKSGIFTGKRDWSGAYVMAAFSLSGIYNTTDSGSVQAVLQNFQAAAY
ncbi:MAG: hypothetical protein NVS3B12_27730 [Acidimicrobiales bacterium]